MSEPITLTKRERAVFESLIKYVRGRCANWVSRGDDAPTGNAVARWMEDWLFMHPARAALKEPAND